MIIINNSRGPQYSLYYLGAKIIELLNLASTPLSIDYIFDKMRRVHKKLSLEYLYLAIDWLFLLDRVEFKGGLLNLL